MKTTIISAALLLLSTAAFATNPPAPKDPSAEATAVAQSSAVGIGVGVGIAGVDNDIKNSNSSTNLNANHNEQGQLQGQLQGQEQSANSDQSQDQSQSANANNTGNAQTTNITSNYRAIRNAPSVSLGSIFPTAGCQAGVGLGGSGVNGSGLINFSFTKKECETIVLAQNFAQIGMPDISCEIMKTTKAFKRAVDAYPELAMLADCTPLPLPTPKVTATPAAPVDLSQYATKEELNRAFQKAQQK